MSIFYYFGWTRGLSVRFSLSYGGGLLPPKSIFWPADGPEAHPYETVPPAMNPCFQCSGWTQGPSLRKLLPPKSLFINGADGCKTYPYESCSRRNPFFGQRMDQRPIRTIFSLVRWGLAPAVIRPLFWRMDQRPIPTNFLIIRSARKPIEPGP